MEKKNASIHQQQPPSSFSWLLDNSSRTSKSLWLQTTLAELDLKIKKILEVVEDDGDTFAQRAEMYYQKKPQLLKMVGDLHKSYRALADKYDLIMLRSESLRAFPHDSASDHDEQPNTAENKVTLSVKKSDHQASDDDDDEYHFDMVEEVEENVVSDHKYKHGWDELLVEVSKLIEENTSKQAELIRRYNMKREDMKQLVEENKRLRDQLGQRKIKIDVNKQSRPSQTNTNSKWKPSNLFAKLLR